MRQWVYPLTVKGKYRDIRRWVGYALQAFLLVVPWITVGGHPAAQFDLVSRRAFVLGYVFTPRDTIFLVLAGLSAAFTLFFFTALFGRLWCGYACPQTVFLEEWVRPVETFFEGDRGARIARDRKGWVWDVIWRKAAKWSVFLGMSVVVAMTATSWFTGAWPLWSGSAGSGAYVVVGVLSMVMFFDFAWFREQFCNYLCPYARFQGALADDGSLVVAYDEGAGEPRRKGGRCIGCEKCVVVCPQGIDIRQGFQLECISCASCVDACESVMSKRGEPSLITYKALEPRPLVRPRTVAYAGLLGLLATAAIVMFANKGELEATVARAPGTLYTVDGDGWIRNTFLLRVSNDSLHAVDVTVVAQLDAAELLVPPVHVAPAGSAMAPVVVRIPPDAAHGDRTLPLHFTVTAGDASVDLTTTFKSGG